MGRIKLLVLFLLNLEILRRLLDLWVWKQEETGIGDIGSHPVDKRHLEPRDGMGSLYG